jgi:hypothetical protein
MHGAATNTALNVTSLCLAATLHIHVMRNASFGIIVTNWQVCPKPHVRGKTQRRSGKV